MCSPTSDMFNSNISSKNLKHATLSPVIQRSIPEDNDSATALQPCLVTQAYRHLLPANLQHGHNFQPGPFLPVFTSEVLQPLQYLPSHSDPTCLQEGTKLIRMCYSTVNICHDHPQVPLTCNITIL